MVNIKKTSKGRKYVKVDGKRIYLSTLLKRINKKRLDENRKPYKSIGTRNIENVLINLMTKGVDIKGTKIKPKKKRVRKIPDIRQKIEKRAGEIRGLTIEEEREKEIKEKKKEQKDLRETILKQQAELLKRVEDLKDQKKKIDDEVIDLYEEKKGEQYTDEEFKRVQDLNEQQRDIEEKIMEQEALDMKIERGITQDDDYWDQLIKEAETKKEEEDLKKKFDKEIKKRDEILDATRRLLDDLKDVREEARKYIGGLLLDKSKALDNSQIEKIMQKYKTFRGVYPVDLIYKGVRMINPKEMGGLILNLDHSGQKGSHWCSLFWNGNGNKPSIEYFDSYGRDPPKEVVEQIKEINKNMESDSYAKLKINRNRMQDFSSVSCGYIAMKFLLDRFRGTPFKKATGYSVKKSEDNAENMEKKYQYII